MGSLEWQHQSEKAKQTKYATELKKVQVELAREVSENNAVLQYLKNEKVKTAKKLQREGKQKTKDLSGLKSMEAMLSKQGVEATRLAEILHNVRTRLGDELEIGKAEHEEIKAAHNKMLFHYLKSKETQLGKTESDERKHETKYAAVSKLASELAQERARAARFKKNNMELMEKIKTEEKRERQVASKLANLKATAMQEVEKHKAKMAQESADEAKTAKAIHENRVRWEKLSNEARHSKHQLQSLRHRYRKETAKTRHEEVPPACFEAAC